MTSHIRFTKLTTLILIFMLTACGTPASAAGEGGQDGVEAALVTYSNASQGFAIGYPGPWTQNPSVINDLNFFGGYDPMTLTFVTPPAETDVMTYAHKDRASVTAAFPGFRQIDFIKSRRGLEGVISPIHIP